MKNNKQIKNIAVIAPAGPVSKPNVYEGVKILESWGKNVEVMPNVFSGTNVSYLAAGAKERVDDLESAWLNPKIDAIMCVRGGFGCSHLLPLINWDALKERSLPVVGYSDITALHFAMEKMGVGEPVVAPMVAKLPEALQDIGTMGEYEEAFGDSDGVREIAKELKFLRAGNVDARPLMGNLTIAASLCGTPFMPSSVGRVVILEDVNERAYRVDRCITQLMQSGFFEGCVGIGLGYFSGCGDEKELLEIFETLKKYTTGPVFMNFPYGHELPLTSLSFARKIRVNSK